MAIDFNARSAPDADLARWLKSQGVDLDLALNIVGPIVEHNVTVFPRGCFDFAQPLDPASIPAVVHAAHGDDVESIVDLIAWTRDQPDRMLRCLGACAALGVDQIANPATYFDGRPLWVRRNALAWLVAGCNGIVPLDFTEVRRRLDRLPQRVSGYRLAAEHLEHGRALRRALMPLQACVRILVPRAEAA